MRDELLGAFDTGVVTALREMAGVEAVHRGPADATADVAVALRLDIGAGWWAVLALPSATATALARRVLAGVADEPDDAMIRDCAAEVLNVTAGQAKTLLYGTPHHFTFATPTTPPAGTAGAAIGFDSECGVFSLRLLPAAAGAPATCSGA
ncbi:chemotaxis protein CheX [bacterium]|nr:chemotaxis protein CheX [bacterium]